MTSASMVERFLTSAEDLIRLKTSSAAYRRRAVSAAYYAVFHALAKLCTSALLPKGGSESDLLRVYRALDHGPLRNAFSQSPLKDHPQIKLIGAAVLNLQSERHRADYLPPNSKLFPKAEVEQLIAQARLTVTQVETLDEASARILATCLLFKERNK